jgi:hypothetical protein
MDYTAAKDAILRKLANYRYARSEAPDVDEKVAAYRKTASALADFKSYHTGKSLFKVDMHDQIIELRDKIRKEKSQISAIGAYQMAFKQLWEQEDQHSWDELASVKAKDIFM